MRDPPAVTANGQALFLFFLMAASARVVNVGGANKCALARSDRPPPLDLRPGR